MPVEAARVETTIDASVDSVWNVLTDTASMQRFFMGAAVTTTWAVGSPITFAGEWEGKRFEDAGAITIFDPPRTLAFTHQSGGAKQGNGAKEHVVTFALSPAGDQTKVVLTQTNLDDMESVTDAMRAQFTQNWASVLEGLKKEVATQQPANREDRARNEPA